MAKTRSPMREDTDAVGMRAADTDFMKALDPQTTVLFVAVAWLMVYAGLGKKQLRWRTHRVCSQCGLRHAPGRCQLHQ
jgi:hypothetical protein